MFLAFIVKVYYGLFDIDFLDVQFRHDSHVAYLRLDSQGGRASGNREEEYGDLIWTSRMKTKRPSDVFNMTWIAKVVAPVALMTRRR